ncbi:MAG TPA: Asp-tRNA(Asn)/Glu-tRNA(Gln) amidotransferase subunit GatB [Gemmatimonadota bacterium]|nr:Asp-tRNA(Asn)/Glu-tRNA(Gln) amidotransferase subunit GatB [Gemmatimonadota bacterium]
MAHRGAARAGTIEALLERFEPVIGLEVHVQLSTASKIFCGCSTEYGAPSNTQVCPICLGYPGTLPMLNADAVELATRAALALGCEVHPRSIFARKHYFYPDLPKGYQISQYDRPLATGGTLAIRLDDGRAKTIRITRVHLEEDAGKSMHAANGTRVDFNRCGVPLIEIVSEPDLASPREAYLYLSALKQTLEYLDVSDCNMEEGSLRCDANVSIRRRGAQTLSTKTEVKNVNSFRYVEAALEFEIERQAGLVVRGERVVHETLLWDSAKGEARPMRSKEMSHDYRYFPEPDLEPLDVDAAWLAEIRAGLPETPAARAARFETDYGLPAYDAGVLTATRPLADWFEAAALAFDDAKEVSNWVMGEVLRLANERGESVAIEPEPRPVAPGRLAELLKLKSDGRISGSAAKEVLALMAETGKGPTEIVRERGLEQLSDAAALEAEIDAVIAAHPTEVAAFRGGKQGLIGFFVGHVMKRTGGQANPQLVNRLLRDKLAG